LRIYHANLAFDFRTEGGGIGARLGFTNGLLNPTRETPTGTGQRALAFNRLDSLSRQIVEQPRLPRLHAFCSSRKKSTFVFGLANIEAGNPNRARALAHCD
jgi:hypothetical protein